MNAAITLQTFNQFAIARRFTGVQTQLWQCLYWLVQSYGQGICIPTYHLLETMGISRSQFTRARNALVQAGCLSIHKTGAQRTHYTVLIDGNIVGADVPGGPRKNKSDSPKKNNQKPNKPVKSIPTGVAPQPDIVMNKEIDRQVEAFVAQHGYSRMVKNKLLQWCAMRRDHRWTLTATGFAGTMATLLQHSGGDEELMINIIDRTLAHQWKGFFPYKVDPIPRVRNCGDSRYGKNDKRGRIPEYDTQKVDLSFLER